ncbi:helix-turn-helix domain-containing protein [Saccharicrinis sp. FJH62]|uniref:helix-turn-helix domain-containing protein n=1 Tax=Saccharicrinis sp. FJH62 TaxID=3344657 RepID=UPI0035D4D7B0
MNGDTIKILLITHLENNEIKTFSENLGHEFQVTVTLAENVKSIIHGQYFDSILYFSSGSLSQCMSIGTIIRSSYQNSTSPIFILNTRVQKDCLKHCLNVFGVDVLNWPVNHGYLILKIQNVLTYRKEIIKKVYAEIAGADNEKDFIKEVAATILEHMDDTDFGVGKLSRIMGISKNHLYRKIKKLTGMTVVSFIQNEKLKVARYLLENGELNISEIAFKTGFSSPSYFTRAFSMSYGKNPKYFRQRLAENRLKEVI